MDGMENNPIQLCILHCHWTVNTFFNIGNRCRNKLRVQQRDNYGTLCNKAVCQEDTCEPVNNFSIRHSLHVDI